MKIKHPTEHDNMVEWVSSNPELFLQRIGINFPYSELTKTQQFPVYDKNKLIGYFDILFSLERIQDDIENDRQKIVKICVIINAKMESAAEQFREMKKIINQYVYNERQFGKQNYYVILSENDDRKSVFTEGDFIFLKY